MEKVEITGHHGEGREITGNHGEGREITGNHGEGREITGNQPPCSMQHIRILISQESKDIYI